MSGTNFTFMAARPTEGVFQVKGMKELNVDIVYGALTKNVRSLGDGQGRLFYPRLPAGHYELWPLASRDDLRAVFSPMPPPAPVDLVVVPGPSSVRMKFQPK